MNERLEICNKCEHYTKIKTCDVCNCFMPGKVLFKKAKCPLNKWNEPMVTNLPPTHTFVYDGAQLNIYHANKGEGLSKHEHTWSHATVCMNGSCCVRKEGKELIINKLSQPLNLSANEWHEIEALEDNTVFVNVFAEDKY